MAIKESTFNKSDIEQFLSNTGNSFASSCWYNDINEERPTHTQTADWFKRFFPTNQAQYLFRLAECRCTQEAAYFETNA
jgi:hypothetical protein